MLLTAWPRVQVRNKTVVVLQKFVAEVPDRLALPALFTAYKSVLSKLGVEVPPCLARTPRCRANSALSSAGHRQTL